MAGTVLFKNSTDNAHRTRYLTNVDDFSSGMKFTNAPHTSGYAKAMVNFDLKNDGECLVPRGGLHDVVNRASAVLAEEFYLDFCVHHSGSMYISEADDTDATLCQYYIAGGVVATGFDVSTAYMVVEYNGEYIKATHINEGISTGVLLMKPAITQMQDLEMDVPKYRDGIYTSLEGNTYVLLNNGTENKLCTIIAKFNNRHDEVNWYIKEVQPTEVQPTQAMNYGYNMFKDNPYTFENVESATGYVQLTGVIPYSEDGKLLLTARPGTPIVFKLYYKYPATDLNNGDKYLVQWEIQDLNNSSDAEIIQKVRGSQEYTPGDDITFAYSPSFTAFSIIVRLYKKSEMAEQDAAWEADTSLQALVTKDDYLTPNQVTTLASYYLTNNNNSSTLNVDAVEYDMGTATGMCTWQQRLVMWGVRGAKSTLFVSEINNPGYMPYPNNCEIFSSDIVCAVPYMTDLLVFTKTALHRLTIADDGLSYTKTCIQERLNMQESDACTVITVQNMVYFKSGNYFYMVVPNNSMSASQDTQLAPVSRPVEQMFNYMEKTISDVLNDVYNLAADGYHNPIELQLTDFNVYVANTQVRNVYKVKVTKQEGANKDVEYYVDVCMNYDTVLRAWTMYTYESTPYRMVLYKPTVTGESIFAHPYIVDYVMYVSLVQADPKNPRDDFELMEHKERTFGNWQFIDTGYRDFSEDLKKRFREVQFCINVLNSEKLKFHTAFVVDDVDVVPLYKYVVTHCTDKSDANYGDIYVERELEDTTDTPDLTEFNAWELDAAMFPDVTVHKVRYKMSSKGYGGSVKILSMNDVPYELLHINWIYRVMFAR